MGLKAMFVDIGFEKNAFLHFWDAIPAALDSGIEEIDRPEQNAAEETDHSQGYSEHLSGRFGRDRPGDERADRHKGPARHDQSEFCRALSRAHAVQRSQRHLAQDRRPEGTRAAAQNSARTRYSRWDWRNHSHRRRRPARALFRARSALPARTMGQGRAGRSKNRPGAVRVFSKSRIWSSAPCAIF